jgi:hypothetical protein
VLAAVGAGGGTGGGKSALAALLEQPFGRVVLIVLGVGLVFFAVWRVVGAIADADGRGASLKGRATRLLEAASGAVYGALALTAFDLGLGRGGGGAEDAAAKDWTEWALDQPLGQWGVAAVGLGVVCGGLAFLWKAWTGDVMKRLSVPPGPRDWVSLVGRLGYAARGVTFVLIGGFLVVAAVHADSDEVKGLGGALRALRQQPYGWALLATVAAGLFAFGAFGFVQARYRRIDVPDMDDAKAALRAAR